MSSTLSNTSLFTGKPVPQKPSNNPLLGDLRVFSRSRAAYLKNFSQQYGPIAQIDVAKSRYIVLSSPEFVQHVLQSHNRNYMKEQFFMNITRMALLGDDVLFTSDGDYWLQQRRLMQPAFHRQRIIGFGDIIIRETERMLTEWDEMAARGQPVELEAAMKNLTMRIVGFTLFSVDVMGDHRDLHHAFSTITNYLVDRAASPIRLPLFVPTPSNRAFRQAIQNVSHMVTEIVRQRQADGTHPGDLLDMLMAARYEDGAQLTMTQLLDEMSGIVNAGQETTSMALMWTFHQLAQNPQCEAQLHEELDRVLGGRLPTVDDLDALPYTLAVLQESMRRYPPAYITTRQAVAEDEIGGYHVPADAKIMINIIGLHHDPAYWSTPDEFQPERFLPPRGKNLIKFAYIPFGAGPRKCIGEPLAMLELHLILAAMAQRFVLRPIAEKPAASRASFVLRTENGMQMHLLPKK